MRTSYAEFFITLENDEISVRPDDNLYERGVGLLRSIRESKRKAVSLTDESEMSREMWEDAIDCLPEPPEA